MSKEDFISYPSLTIDAASEGTQSTVQTLTTSSQTQPRPMIPAAYRGVSFSAGSIGSAAIGSTVCAKCQKQINVSMHPGAIVVLSCRHSMHGSCFVRTVTEQNLHSSCDDNFGGPQHCVHCFASPLVNMYDFKPVVDHEETLVYFRANFVKKYRDSEYTKSLKTTELSLENKRTICGILTSIWTRDNTDYSMFRPGSAENSREITQMLIARGRTLENIFANTSKNFNAQHVYRLGVTNFEDFRLLGYDAARHGQKEYREKCPYWMLVDLYNLDQSVLFEFQSADDLLAKQLHPKELFLCGVTLDILLEKRLSKRAFIAYRFAPDELLTYLGLNHSHLISLNIKRGDLPESWSSSADSRVKHILSNIPQ